MFFNSLFLFYHSRHSLNNPPPLHTHNVSSASFTTHTLSHFKISPLVYLLSWRGVLRSKNFVGRGVWKKNFQNKKPIFRETFFSQFLVAISFLCSNKHFLTKNLHAKTCSFASGIFLPQSKIFDY